MPVKNKEKADIIAVAKAARVSPSTVSRSFNHPDLVKPATRKKIDAAVRRLGYIRNRAAQTIHGIRSGKPAVARPWEGARGLEWTLPSPAPYHSFTYPPEVKEGEAHA